MMTEWISCPFCGEIERLGVSLLPEPVEIWYAYCKNCDAYGPSAKTKKEAIEAWNRRYDPEVDDGK